jgi:hypothetical protein
MSNLMAIYLPEGLVFARISVPSASGEKREAQLERQKASGN